MEAATKESRGLGASLQAGAGRQGGTVFLPWFALGLTGQAALLVTVWAGRSVHFQHARPLAHPAAALGSFVLAARAAPEPLMEGFRRAVEGSGARIPLAAAVVAFAVAASLNR